MFFFLVLPLAAVFTEALRKGVEAYWVALQEPDAWSAIRLTFITALIAVPLNLVFGIAAAWAIAKYEFRGKAFLTTLGGLAILCIACGRGFDLCFDVWCARLVWPLVASA
jgi:ABC-type sulfate transport system permease subunit